MKLIRSLAYFSLTATALEASDVISVLRSQLLKNYNNNNKNNNNNNYNSNNKYKRTTPSLINLSDSASVEKAYYKSLREFVKEAKVLDANGNQDQAQPQPSNPYQANYKPWRSSAPKMTEINNSNFIQKIKGHDTSTAIDLDQHEQDINKILNDLLEQQEATSHELYKEAKNPNRSLPELPLSSLGITDFSESDDMVKILTQLKENQEIMDQMVFDRERSEANSEPGDKYEQWLETQASKFQAEADAEAAAAANKKALSSETRVLQPNRGTSGHDPEERLTMQNLQSQILTLDQATICDCPKTTEFDLPLIGDNSNRIDHLFRLSRSQTSHLETQAEKILHLAKTFDNNKSSLNSKLDATNENLEKQTEDIKSQISEQSDKLIEEISKNQDDVKENNAQVSDLRTTVQGMAHNINSLAGKESLKGLAELVAANTRAIKLNSERLAEFGSVLGEIKIGQSERESALKELVTDDALERESQIMASLEELGAAREASLQAQIDALSKRLTAILEQSASKEDLANVEAEVDAAEAKQSAAETLLEEAKADFNKKTETVVDQVIALAKEVTGVSRLMTAMRNVFAGN